MQEFELENALATRQTIACFYTCFIVVKIKININEQDGRERVSAYLASPLSLCVCVSLPLCA